MGQEIKLVRFIDLNAAKYILHPNSTFILRSLRYYRDLEEVDKDKNRGDMAEGLHKDQDGNTNEISGCIISCWCLCDDESDMSTYWNLFPESHFALFSSNLKVRKVLQKKCDSIFHQGKGKHIEDKPLEYYADAIPSTEDISKLAFQKRNRKKQNKTCYRDEKEYRFALMTASCEIQSLIFHVAVEDYIDKILINPELDKCSWCKLQEHFNNCADQINPQYWKKKIGNFAELTNRFPDKY